MDTGDRRAWRFHLGGLFRQQRHGGRIDPAKRAANPDRIRPATPAFPYRRRVGDGRAEGGRGIFSQLGLPGERRRYGKGRAWRIRTDPAQFLIRLRTSEARPTSLPAPARSSMSVADEFAFSIPNLPSFKAETFAKCAASQTTSSDRTTTDFRRDDVQVCFVPILFSNSGSGCQVLQRSS